jgi:P4 family phage/plasmid primase-like protien
MSCAKELKHLESLLKENHVHESFFTHVSLKGGKYSLNLSVLSKFWELYCKIVRNKEENIFLSLAESPKSHNAVIVDVDLKFREWDEKSDRLYTLSFVEKLIQIYQKVLEEVIEDIDEKQLMCILLEKPVYSTYHYSDNQSNKIYKNGFHLHFPYLFISKEYYEMIVIPKIKQQIQQNTFDIKKDFSKFSELLIHKDEDEINNLIDTGALKNSWLLYKSRKSEEQQPYLISKIYNNKLQTLTLEEGFKSYVIYDENEEPIQLNNIETIEFNLPRILSIRPHGRKISDIKKEVINKPPLLRYIKIPSFTPIIDDEFQEEEEKKDDETINKELEEVKQLLKFFKPFRHEDYHQWMTIGWAIYNISKGSEEGRKIWFDFSKNSKKYNEFNCMYVWTRMQDRKRITIGTLKYFAKQDNPEGYFKYITEINSKNILKDLKSTHWDIAMLLYRHYSNEFSYSDTSGWYQFKEHHWEFISNGNELRSKISNDLTSFFDKVKKEIYLQLAETQDESKTENLKKKEKEVILLMKNLKTTTYKANVMKECQEIFFVRNFERKLNTNPYLIGFKNGVYDLKDDIFRDGLPNDYISLQMPINYQVFSETDNRVQEVYDFFEKVFPDKSLRRYFMDIMSEIFVGYNHRKQVYFWTGEGDNGKSITQMFIEKMLGPLSIKTPTTLITSKRPSSGSANAELARAGNGVRTTFLEEPDPDEQVCTGVFKHLSGNDSIYTRDLFQRGKDITELKPMFKMMVICNKLPKIRQGGDKATWNRIRVIPFESTFVKKAPPTLEEQIRDKTFPVDTNLAQRIPSLVEPLAWILLKHRQKPKIDDPEKVVAATDRYRITNDILHQFSVQVVEEDEKSSIKQSELYYRYKEWLTENIPSDKKPITLLDFSEYFQKKWGVLNEFGQWNGKRFRDEKEKNNDLNRIL